MANITIWISTASAFPRPSPAATPRRAAGRGAGPSPGQPRRVGRARRPRAACGPGSSSAAMQAGRDVDRVAVGIAADRQEGDQAVEESARGRHPGHRPSVRPAPRGIVFSQTSASVAGPSARRPGLTRRALCNGSENPIPRRVPRRPAGLAAPKIACLVLQTRGRLGFTHPRVDEDTMPASRARTIEDNGKQNAACSDAHIGWNHRHTGGRGI